MSEWEPGDVAMVAGGTDGPWLALVRPRGAANGRLEFAYLSGGFDMVGELSDGFSARPLVVIDPEDAEQVERLWRAWTTLAPDHRLAQDCMQAALREFARPTPRIEEPQGLGAVVEDAEGDLWIRVVPAQLKYAWRPSGTTSSYEDTRYWPKVNAVRVLSHGVTEGES